MQAAVMRPRRWQTVAIFGGLVLLVTFSVERFREKTVLRTGDPGEAPLLARPVFLPRLRGENALREVLHTTNFSAGVDSPSLWSPVYHARQPTQRDSILEIVSGDDVIYFVKACKRYGHRAVAMYKSWGSSVKHLVFSTDYPIEELPLSMQIVSNLDNEEAQKYLARGGKIEPIHIPKSCAVSVNNLGKLLRDERFHSAKWLVLLDDDTFVIPRNLQTYLSYFDSSVSYYMGFSNAEISGIFTGKRKLVPASSTAPGCAYSKKVMDVLRAGGPRLDIAIQSVALKVCSSNSYKDDVAISFLPLVDAEAKFVARPELRGYHFGDMKDPVQWTPLTIHGQLAFLPAVDPETILMKLRVKYKAYFNA